MLVQYHPWLPDARFGAVIVFRPCGEKRHPTFHGSGNTPVLARRYPFLQNLFHHLLMKHCSVLRGKVRQKAEASNWGQILILDFLRQEYYARKTFLFALDHDKGLRRAHSKYSEAWKIKSKDLAPHCSIPRLVILRHNSIL